jgi:predicted Rossmann fold nucleotide-binding protein DprA/Smf involved in DNA uptake
MPRRKGGGEMSAVQKQLAGIAKSLATLSKQVEKISKQVEKAKAAKAPAAKKRSAPKSPAKPKKKAAAKKTLTVLDSVFDAVRRSRNGITIAKLKEKTGLESRQLSNALYKLTKREKIVAKSRGVYVKK